ncbi:MAG: thioesterase [Eubacteriales bacterium]|nr:thioesterase [Eubacteriales bacterium]
MNGIYKETLTLRPANCDMGQAWKSSALLEALQDTAGEHSRLLGLDRETLLRETGLIWVVSRLHVETTRTPLSGERIEIETYPTTPRHAFYPRYHILRGEDGEQFGAACSLWMTIDCESRRAAKHEYVQERMPANAGLSPVCALPATVRPLGGEACRSAVTPQYTDLDVNMHVNNTKYLDWCCNALGLETMREHTLASFDINYDSEVRPGMQIAASLTREGERFSFFGESEQRRHFAIGGSLRPRP